MIPSFRRVRARMHRLCYRLTRGAIGGGSPAMPILLLTTTGRKTGRPRTTPLLYVTDGENVVVVASNAGRPQHPQWWLNLAANPEAKVQMRNEKRLVRAAQAAGEERERLWRLVVEMYPEYEEFQKTANRQFPIVILRPRE
jgi:deazaflavin-dependent oxidoreductase (nitroreductase family)